MSFRFNDRRRDSEDQHVDDWLMTYADMITLLLCFFAIFLAFSTPKEEEMKRAEQEVREEFAKGKIVSQDAFQPISDKPLDKMPSIIDRYRGDLGAQPEPGQGPEQEKEKEEGDRIQVIEMDSALFFGSGSAELSDEGKAALSQMLPQFQSGDYKDYMITVEGHTDDSPISTLQFPSNWELSSARASAVVRYYISLGIPASRLRAAGYADALPKVPNRNAGGRPIPANQAENRRVVIKLEKIE